MIAPIGWSVAAPSSILKSISAPNVSAIFPVVVVLSLRELDAPVVPLPTVRSKTTTGKELPFTWRGASGAASPIPTLPDED